MDTQKQENNNRLCDFCSKETALLYCRADSAKLCLSCDREVHSTNQLFTKHTRWLLCDNCDSCPVSIFCRSDNLVLCQNCDWETHNNNNNNNNNKECKKQSCFVGVGRDDNLTQPEGYLTRQVGVVHDRRPVDGFSGQPSVNELLGILGLDDLGKKGEKNGFGNDYGNCRKCETDTITVLRGVCDDYGNCDIIEGGVGGEFGMMDLLAWDTPSIVDIDELIAYSNPTSEHNFQAMGVPPLPKNRNSVCGQHKEDILHQLRELTKLDADLNDFEVCLDSFIEYQSDVPGPDCQLETKETRSRNSVEPTLVPSYEASGFDWSKYVDEFTDEKFPATLVSGHADTSFLVPEKDSDAGGSSNLYGGQEGQPHHLVTIEDIHPLPKVAREINTQERDSALSRYKEKKKSRRFEKQIRYESRKVRAETRIRIKGRFAKMGQSTSCSVRL